MNTRNKSERLLKTTESSLLSWKISDVISAYYRLKTKQMTAKSVSIVKCSFMITNASRIMLKYAKNQYKFKDKEPDPKRLPIRSPTTPFPNKWTIFDHKTKQSNKQLLSSF